MSRQGGNRWLSVGRTREKCGVMVLPGVAAGEAAVKPGSAVPIHSHSCGKRNGIFHLFFLQKVCQFKNLMETKDGRNMCYNIKF